MNRLRLASALTMERDRGPLEDRGAVAAARIGLSARVRTLREWKHTGSILAATDALYRELLHIEPIIAAGMLAGHLAGVRRTLMNVEQHGRTSRAIRLSTAYEGALGLLRARLGLSAGSTEDLRQRYGEVASGVAAKEAASAAAAVGETLAKSLQEGDSERQATEKLRQALTSVGVLPDADHRLATTFRTQTNLAYQAGRINSLRDPAVDSILWGYEYVTVGDDRVRPAHAAMDGVKRPKDDPIWDVWTPPNGYNCRCSILEIFDGGTATAELPDVQPDSGFAFNPADLAADIDQRVVIDNRIPDVADPAEAVPDTKVPAVTKRSKPAKTLIPQAYGDKATGAELQALADELVALRDGSEGWSEASSAVLDNRAIKVVLRDKAGAVRGVVSFRGDADTDSIRIRHLGAVGGVRGTGTELVRHVLQRAAKDRVGVVLESTAEARGFYEKLGFKLRGGYANVYELDAEQTKTLAKQLGKPYKPKAPPKPSGIVVHATADESHAKTVTGYIKDNIPAKLHDRVAGNGGAVMISRISTDGFPELQGVSGLRGWPPGFTYESASGFYSTDRKIAVVASHTKQKSGENTHYPKDGGPPVTTVQFRAEEKESERRVKGTTLHEYGHMVDALFDPSPPNSGQFFNARYLSESQDFYVAYEEERAALQAETGMFAEVDRDTLSYFLQQHAAGRSEAFAEGFAILHGEGGAGPNTQGVFRKRFPKTLAAIKRLIKL